MNIINGLKSLRLGKLILGGAEYTSLPQVSDVTAVQADVTTLQNGALKLSGMTVINNVGGEHSAGGFSPTVHTANFIYDGSGSDNFPTADATQFHIGYTLTGSLLYVIPPSGKDARNYIVHVHPLDGAYMATRRGLNYQQIVFVIYNTSGTAVKTGAQVTIMEVGGF